jgi:hypothetical protein
VELLVLPLQLQVLGMLQLKLAIGLRNLACRVQVQQRQETDDHHAEQ